MRIPQSNKDRRVQKTREALRMALTQLLAERSWDDIDVQSLCERANIGRSTFYQHFANKEELLNRGLENLRMHLQGFHSVSEPLGFLPGLIQHVYERKDIFRTLTRQRAGRYVQRRFAGMLLDLIKVDMPKRLRKGWKHEARAEYLAGALFELLSWWLCAERPQKPEEIVQLYKELSLPVLAAKV